ncbi:hypothetical protein TNCV_3382061 [Trichonephila clavipes]|nr:hypothetical protein TNCV_3382061 [Trichonephila clavipes]
MRDPRIENCSANGFHLPVGNKDCFWPSGEAVDYRNKEVAEASMQSAALEELTLTNSSNIIISGDGTWKTRGYSSRVGVCAVIGDKTGKCIDAKK